MAPHPPLALAASAFVSMRHEAPPNGPPNTMAQGEEGESDVPISAQNSLIHPMAVLMEQ